MIRALKTKFWSLVAKNLAAFRDDKEGLPSRAYWPLYQYALDRPYYPIDGYMYRHWLIEHPHRKGDAQYGTFRNWLRRLYPFYARFHCILRADNDRHLHNHPFPFTSMIMSGWYIEEAMNAHGVITRHTYRVGDVNYKAGKGGYHRIVEVAPEGVLTLVIMGARHGNSWGFLVNGKHIHWAEYLRAKEQRDAVINGLQEILVEYES